MLNATRHHTSPLLAGVIAGVVIALFIGTLIRINVDYGAPWATTHTLHLAISDVDAITAGSDVRTAGRLAGQVTDVQAAGDHSVVTIQVQSDAWPLPSDTTASVRLATLLGQKYVQLEPGHSGTTLADDATIGLQATKPVVDFDQLLNSFNAPTRGAITSIVRTLGTPGTGAVAGEQDTLQQLVPSLSDLNARSVTPTNELAVRDPQLNSILTDLATTSGTLAASRDDLAGTIDNLNAVTTALAGNQDALRAFIRDTDALNRTTQSILGGPAAAQLNAGLQQLPEVTTQLDTLLRTLVPQSTSFLQNSYAQSLDLIFEIGDATSQGDQGGFFLRENAAGLDLSGLLPPQLTSPQTPAPPAAPSTPGLPGIHNGPLPPLPSPPALPGLPTPLPLPNLCLPPLPGLTPTPAPGPGQTPCPSPLPSPPGGAFTSPPAGPTPTPICVLSVCLASYYYSGGDAPAAAVDEFPWWAGA